MIVADVCLVMGSDIHASGAGIDIDADVLVLADPGRLRQVFQNLIQNAIVYRHAERVPRVSISARQLGNGFVQVDVADNGMGIAARNQQRIFKMFKQLKGNEGTGIGLALVERIVDNAGGTVWVTSDGKSGSTFSFTLRAAQ